MRESCLLLLETSSRQFLNPTGIWAQVKSSNVPLPMLPLLVALSGRTRSRYMKCGPIVIFSHMNAFCRLTLAYILRLLAACRENCDSCAILQKKIPWGVWSSLSMQLCNFATKAGQVRFSVEVLPCRVFTIHSSPSCWLADTIMKILDTTLISAESLEPPISKVMAQNM